MITAKGEKLKEAHKKFVLYDSKVTKLFLRIIIGAENMKKMATNDNFNEQLLNFYYI